MVIGVDVGGTFTDIVEADERGIRGRKVPTSPDQSQGVASAVHGEAGDLFLHGTTAATNALLEGRGGRVSLVTNSGYEDLIEIARQDRPSLYDSSVDRPVPLVERSDRVGFTGDIEAVVEAVRLIQPDAVAVSLIESYEDPTKEREIADALRATANAPVVESSKVSPEFREYERTATTALSAYLTPSVASYLKALDSRLEIDRRLIMTSSGGLIPFSGGAESAGRLVLSGPAGGAVAAAALGGHYGYRSVLSFDMGGTSTDVCRITDGSLAVGAGHAIGGRVNRVPSVPIRTIGAGGGSLGWVDAGSALRVGPRSAGAEPGPACYGRGGVEPTVTDANVVLGNIPADLALGGTVSLDANAARGAMRRIGEVIGLSVEEVAAGMIEVVDTHMENALRAVSVEEGADPREAVLVAFGGAGGLHASRLARRLGMGTVLVPPLSGVFSALGLMMAAPRSDRARTLMLDEGSDHLVGAISRLEDEVRAEFRRIYDHQPTTLMMSADLRYRGQSHELEVDVDEWAPTRERFESSHHQRFGFTRPDEPIELVNLRSVALGDPPLTWSDLPRIEPSGGETNRGNVWFREALGDGVQVDGPALVVEENAAILLERGDAMTVLADGTLEIQNG
ncbi:MAG: hydantoinase/oxoprolinase family protein [Acidimicrobiia bacterium]